MPGLVSRFLAFWAWILVVYIWPNDSNSPSLSSCTCGPLKPPSNIFQDVNEFICQNFYDIIDDVKIKVSAVSITYSLSISLSSLHSHAMSSLAINAWKNACRVFQNHNRWEGKVWMEKYMETVCLCVCTCVWYKFDFFLFFFVKIEFDLYFLNHFNVLISKIIFKKWKNIIDMYFSTKSYLKSNHYHTAKHARNLCRLRWCSGKRLRLHFT